MLPKPSHFSAEYGAWFKDADIVAAYPTRPPYPESVIRLLVTLCVDAPRTVLDVGCGPGDLARRLAPLVDRVDAVDFSAGMIEQGQRLPGGKAVNLRWILGAAEHAALAPPYALITAGESLHWMDWDVVLPRFGAALTTNGLLAIVEREWSAPLPLRERLLEIFGRHSPVRDYRPVNLVQELEQRRLFTTLGRQHSETEPWQPSVDEYLESRHSQRGFSRTHMGQATAAAFDADIRQALEACCEQGVIELIGGRLQLAIEATIVWGRPLAPH